MGLAGPKGPTKKREAELIGGLYLVGARGKCCAVITERQLTIERFDGKGVRLDLAAIERMRHLKIPMLPSGTILLGLIAIYLGITTIVAPMSWLAVGAGASVILANVVSRYSILAIETGSGDRHLVSGSESNLLKLCLIVDRVRHGSGMEEALLGLENLDSEVPVFPSIRDSRGRLDQESQVALPLYSQDNQERRETDRLDEKTGFGIEEEIGVFNLPAMEESLRTEATGGFENVIMPSTPVHSSSDKQNAYERAWGVTEAPTWYQEKDKTEDSGSRIDSAFSDAAEGLDMFAPGGLFDTEASQENSDSSNMGLFDFNEEVSSVDPIERLHSSSQMIKRAHEEFGAPLEPFSRSLLPPPTEEAVRDECKAGVVRQAKARQALRTRRMGESGIQHASLEDYPALNKLASTMSGNRPANMSRKGSSSGGWLSRLLSPSSSLERSMVGKSKPPEIQTESFQSAQHMRLRSDQDHQAEVGARIRSMRNRSIGSSTAKDKLDSIVRSLSGERGSQDSLVDGASDSLKFSQLKPTSSKEDPHPLPGLRRLG